MRTPALALIALLANITLAHADITCRVNDPTGTPLNVRATAPKGRILEKLRNGTPVRVLDVFSFQGKIWARLGDKDRVQIGWVYRDYLDCEATADTDTSISPPYSAFTGNTLLKSCTADQATAPMDVLQCATYVLAVAGTMIVWQTVAPVSAQFCIPEEATGEQLKDIAVRWLRANPTERHLNGAITVSLAFQEAWPTQCRARQGGFR
jgi:hypothetical protein